MFPKNGCVGIAVPRHTGRSNVSLRRLFQPDVLAQVTKPGFDGDFSRIEVGFLICPSKWFSDNHSTQGGFPRLDEQIHSAIVR